ncbi:MAG: hypothetical protein C4589_10045 [Peptococcaceae bacterium]|nr:MAG: hypothetical protein C4589_10045 [Peptococcaceae bacterium]
MGVQDRDWHRDWWKEFKKKEREERQKIINRSLEKLKFDYNYYLGDDSKLNHDKALINRMIGTMKNDEMIESSSFLARDIFIFLFGVILGVLATMQYFDII